MKYPWLMCGDLRISTPLSVMNRPNGIFASQQPQLLRTSVMRNPVFIANPLGAIDPRYANPQPSNKLSPSRYLKVPAGSVNQSGLPCTGYCPGNLVQVLAVQQQNLLSPTAGSPVNQAFSSLVPSQSTAGSIAANASSGVSQGVQYNLGGGVTPTVTNPANVSGSGVAGSGTSAGTGTGTGNAIINTTTTSN